MTQNEKKQHFILYYITHNIEKKDAYLSHKISPIQYHPNYSIKLFQNLLVR